MKRPELEKAIETLGPDDVLVLAEWDRATQSMLDGSRSPRLHKWPFKPPEPGPFSCSRRGVCGSVSNRNDEDARAA